MVPHTPSRLSVDTKMRSPLLSEVMMTPRTPSTTATPTATTPTTPRPEEVAKEEPLTPKPSREFIRYSAVSFSTNFYLQATVTGQRKTLATCEEGCGSGDEPGA